MIKSKTITTIILEGCDGVGKDSVAKELWKDFERNFRIYVRGEMSDYVYAKKYCRRFVSTQRGLPIIYVLLIAEKQIIKDRILNRGYGLEDANLVDDQDLFLKAAKDFEKDYHVLVVCNSHMTPQETAAKIKEEVQRYSDNLASDERLNEYNKMYQKGCERLGLHFEVKDNQPYIDHRMIMADAQLHNGEYETFTNKVMPHNLIFSLGYTQFVDSFERPFDFSYIISSKIEARPEVNQYFKAFEEANLSCMKRSTFPDKLFGDAFLSRLSKAKATIYCCRDLAYLKMITVRPYEAALSNQILFVDAETDTENAILQQIHDGSKYEEILRVTPESIAYTYKNLTKADVDHILEAQRSWYSDLRQQLIKREKEKKS